MLRPPLNHTLFDDANIISFLQTLHPGSVLWMPLFQTSRPAELRQQALTNQIPGDERQIGESALVAYQPASTTRLQAELEHADNAVDFVRVALDGRWKLLRVKAREPSRLAIVRPLTYAG